MTVEAIPSNCLSHWRWLLGEDTMMTGQVTANRESVIELKIVGLERRREKVEAVIDKGFNGDTSNITTAPFPHPLVFFTVRMRSLSASFF